ncbi:hypothetical protein [Ruegeria sp. EL01]|jgi:hypothetical protein|uniref:hypothetical protein n=1 Tax=Ruegeria sp. EL01 TaxID=2107578 RepID=UPI000EA812FD|nr:hypothetical protein [Ruegeria sp. EL01]
MKVLTTAMVLALLATVTLINAGSRSENTKGSNVGEIIFEGDGNMAIGLEILITIPEGVSGRIGGLKILVTSDDSSDVPGGLLTLEAVTFGPSAIPGEQRLVSTTVPNELAEFFVEKASDIEFRVHSMSAAVDRGGVAYEFPIESVTIFTGRNN